MRKIINKLDKRGNAAFAVRECGTAALEVIEEASAKQPLLTWLRLKQLATYETPVDPQASFHLVSQKDIDKCVKRDVKYLDDYIEQHGPLPVCAAHEVLSLANRKFAAKSNVIAWEFDTNKLEREPLKPRNAFRRDSRLRSTDFGFAFEFSYWGQAPWRDWRPPTLPP